MRLTHQLFPSRLECLAQGIGHGNGGEAFGRLDLTHVNRRYIGLFGERLLREAGASTKSLELLGEAGGMEAAIVGNSHLDNLNTFPKGNRCRCICLLWTPDLAFASKEA